jgi:hypothetical protein
MERAAKIYTAIWEILIFYRDRNRYEPEVSYGITAYKIRCRRTAISTSHAFRLALFCGERESVA